MSWHCIFLYIDTAVSLTNSMFGNYSDRMYLFQLEIKRYQLIRYARASSNYSDFLTRHLHLRNRLLDQGYKKIRLIRSIKKFIFDTKTLSKYIPSLQKRL